MDFFFLSYGRVGLEAQHTTPCFRARIAERSGPFIGFSTVDDKTESSTGRFCTKLPVGPQVLVFFYRDPQVILKCNPAVHLGCFWVYNAQKWGHDLPKKSGGNEIYLN